MTDTARLYFLLVNLLAFAGGIALAIGWLIRNGDKDD